MQYYRPGERVHLAFDGRYFTDKPMAGGAVTLEAALQAEPASGKLAAPGPAAAAGVVHATMGLRSPRLRRC